MKQSKQKEIRIYTEYLWYIIKHKYYVMVECFKVGLYWQGVIHDFSKFSSHEFKPYMNMYTRPRITGVKVEPKDNRAFDVAWLHHIHNNSHHWEHWILDGKPLDMPFKYILEMVCDWHGAGLAITGKKDTLEWYNKHKSSIHLSDNTRYVVEQLLSITNV